MRLPDNASVHYLWKTDEATNRHRDKASQRKADAGLSNCHLDDLPESLATLAPQNKAAVVRKLENRVESLLRKANSGPNAGESFWGCSGYPACKTIKAPE